MSCEICGNDIRGRGIKVVVEGAKLTVCSDCADLGERVREEPYGRTVVKSSPGPRGSVKPVKSPPPSRPPPVPRQIPIRKPKAQPSEESQEIVENYAEIVKKARGAMTTDEFAATLNEKATVIQKIETGKLHLTLKLAKKIEKQYRVKLINQRDAAEDIEDVIWKPEKKVDFTPSLGDFVKQKKE